MTGTGGHERRIRNGPPPRGPAACSIYGTFSAKRTVSVPGRQLPSLAIILSCCPLSHVDLPDTRQLLPFEQAADVPEEPE